MSDGGFRCFVVAAVLATAAVRAADPPGTGPTGIITNTAPLSIVSTNNLVPPVVSGTNSVLSADERRAMEAEAAAKVADEAYEKKVAAEKKKWEAATNNLGVYHVIPANDPFRLIKPEIEKPAAVIRARPNFGVPHLAGISLLNGVRAVLRVNPPRGGKAQYVRLQEGEMLQDADGNNYGEVLKIDPKKGIVEVKVKGQTFPLEIDKAKMMASRANPRSRGSSTPSRGSSTPSRGSSTPSRGSSSSRYSRPSSGSSSQRPSGGSSSKTPSRTTPSRTTPSRTPPRKGGGLQSVPSRRKTGSLNKLLNTDPSLHELPAFNEAVQKLIINPLDITSQREIIRGQHSFETPTDLPPGQR